MKLSVKIDNIFNNFLVSTSVGFFSGGVLYIVSKDLIEMYNYKNKRTKLTLYNLFNYGGFGGFMLGVTRWYLQAPVLDYFLKLK